MTDSSPDVNPFERGQQLQRDGRLVEAAAYYREALSQKPDDHRALHGLGLLAQQSGDLRAAESLLRAAAGFGENPDYRVSLGLLLQKTGRPREAGDAFRAALAAAPEHFAALFNQGHLLQRMGKTAAALAHYERALSVNADDFPLLVNVATLLNLTGDYERAEQLCRHAIRLRPELAGAHDNLGIALAAQKQYDEAAEAFRRSLTLQPDQPGLYTKLGDCLLATGQLQSAGHAFENCLRRSPGDTNALAKLSALQQSHGAESPAAALLNFATLLDTSMLRLDRPGLLPELRDLVLLHPTLQTNVTGTRANNEQKGGSLLPSQSPLITHVVDHVRQRVAAYIANCPEDWRPLPALGQIWPPPLAWRLDMRASLLPAGCAQPHFHASGWLSGVIAVDESRGSAPDSIEFGCLPDDLSVPQQPLIHQQPLQAGQLVLFPSYFYHRIVPARADVARASIVIDIIPRRESQRA